MKRNFATFMLFANLTLIAICVYLLATYGFTGVRAASLLTFSVFAAGWYGQARRTR